MTKIFGTTSGFSLALQSEMSDLKSYLGHKIGYITKIDISNCFQPQMSVEQSL